MLIAKLDFTIHLAISQWLYSISTEYLLCSQAMDDHNGTVLSSPCVSVSLKVL